MNQDGCHKIYVVASEADQEEAVRLKYNLYELDQLPKIWEESCPLKFISPLGLNTKYIEQGDMAYATLVFKDEYNDILIMTNYNEYKGDLKMNNNEFYNSYQYLYQKEHYTQITAKLDKELVTKFKKKLKKDDIKIAEFLRNAIELYLKEDASGYKYKNSSQDGTR